MATYTVTTSEGDETALANDITDPNAWIQAAVTGKVANAKKRMINEWRPKVFADDSVESIPANDDDFIAMVVARDDYKTRAERDAENSLP
jgi:hypothetical protein